MPGSATTTASLGSTAWSSAITRSGRIGVSSETASAEKRSNFWALALATSLAPRLGAARAGARSAISAPSAARVSLASPMSAAWVG